MAGALSGAYLGLQRIPVNWARHVHDKSHTTYEDFLDLVQKVYQIKFGQFTIEEKRETEGKGGEKGDEEKEGKEDKEEQGEDEGVQKEKEEIPKEG